MLLVPAYSDVVPTQVSTQVRLTKNITLATPLMSAAMDTVTESRLAIAIAQQGGMGVVHRNLTIEQQAGEIDKVKRSESGMIVDPVTIEPERPISDALEVMRRFKISGVPVTKKGKLVGILTNRDLRFVSRTDIPIGDVMTKENLITVPVGTTLEQAEHILHQHRVEKLLVVNDAYELKGLITVKDIQKKLKYPSASKDEQGRLRVAGAIGATGDYLERAAELVKMRVDALAIDSAHGHSERVLEAVGEVKKAFPDVDLLAGNVATYEGTKALIDAGADAVKVGIGPGSICTTRMVTGAGMPQITAISETFRSHAGHVECVRAHAVADHFSQYLCAARLGKLQLFQDQDARAFADHKSVAVLIQRPAGVLRIVVAGRKRLHRGKATDAHRRNGRFGAARDHRIGIAALDDAEGVADGVRAGGAGGRSRFVRPARACTGC